ncbi:unnamed protein product [Clonostachys rosea f. rosea IK726]|uniref:Uncharacterized protein n=1 Tax=Clonostachys rosea f. rosea IK726 TaxID=1349383 RepID=A0ACA9TF52_BIOOC|nr:unnamed protein product [Clonostachys rosea f. rosea IK726]
MKRLSTLLALLPLTLGTPLRRTEPAPLFTHPNSDLAGPDKYIVKFRDGTAQGTVKETLEALDQIAEHIYLERFKGFAGILDAAALENWRAHPDVEYIEQDSIVRATAYVEQPGSPWGLARISSRRNGADKYVYDESAGAGTCSYVIDTGIEASHPDFDGRAIQVVSFAGDNTDGNGHGTAVAGVIGGTTYGVAKKTTLLAIKVFDASGSGTTSQVLSGISHVTQDAAARSCPRGVFVNLSIGGSYSATLNAAVAALVAEGKFVAVAAGSSAANAGNFSPGSEESVCTASASTSLDARSSSANYGAVVDIFAPGQSILTTYLNGGTATLSGSSFASAHICGLAAYLSALEKTPNPATLCSRIRELATSNTLTGIPQGTDNLLAFNGSPQG